jgi:hypothetical protein
MRKSYIRKRHLAQVFHVLGNSLAPNRIFNAILHSLFSAAAELAPLRHPRRPTSSGSLEERISKAKSSMVATAISQNIIQKGVPFDIDIFL